MTKDQLEGILASHNLFDGLKHNEEFEKWYPENLHVINAFGRYALQLKNVGNRKHYSCYAIRERIRWDSMICENGTEYKISNNVTPYVARILMAARPDLCGMFKTKVQKNDVDS